MRLFRRSLLCLVVGVTAQGRISYSQTPVGTARSKKTANQTFVAFRDAGQSGRWGFIDRSGAVVITPRFTSANDFVDQHALVEFDGRKGLIDMSGAPTFRLPTNGRRAQLAGAGRIWHEVSTGTFEHWGLLDIDGRQVVPPTYSEVRPFAEDRAAVCVGSRRAWEGYMSGGKWGFVDAAGVVRIPFHYDEVRDFSEGLAAAKDRQSAMYVDKLGEVVLYLGEPEAGGLREPGDFREGLAPVREHVRHVSGDVRTRFIDRTGRTVHWVEGRAGEICDGLSLVAYGWQLAGSYTYGFVDRQGRTAFPVLFADARPFSEGLAAVCPKRSGADPSGSLWGYIDRNGLMVIPPAFNEAFPFRNGFAKVHTGGSWVTVSDAPSYWKGGEWWLIAARGKRIAQCD